MKNSTLGLLLLAALYGCTDKPATVPKAAVRDPAAGKAVAEKECKTCHGLDGKGVAPAIPNLAAQREAYLVASLKEYKDGTRGHAQLRNMTNEMSESNLRNVAAYYANLPPVANAVATDVKHSSPYDEGKKLAQQCAACHGEDGNSKTEGTPTLAGQQPHYLVAAIEEYHQGDRAAAAMKSMVRGGSRIQLENLALYLAAQTPVQRGAPARGDAAAGAPATAMCGGCHGARGVSADAATPSLAGQDFNYLVKAIKSYKTTRKNWGMQRYVGGLGDRDIDNIAAYYATQAPKAAEQVPTSIQKLAEQCNRCHDQTDSAAVVAPKMRGQDKDYLVMALRAYRDGKRESTTMHSMSFPYSNAIIESLASWYASQPPK